MIDFCVTNSTPPSVFTFLVGKLHNFAWKILWPRGGERKKIAKNLPKSPKQTKPSDFDSFFNISWPHYAFEGWVFFLISSWTWGHFEHRKHIIYGNFFLLPPLAVGSFRQKLCSLPTKNVKTEGGVEFVTQKSIIWPLPFFLNLINQKIDTP